MSRLAGKVAIVTGGAGGIGAATAHELAREGAAVAVVDIDEAKAAGDADEIRQTGARAIALGGDLAEEHSARHVVQATVAFSTAILTEATLSYLGLGTQPPTPSWGTIPSFNRVPSQPERPWCSRTNL